LQDRGDRSPSIPMRTLKDTAGFTLIELLIVMALIGILAGVGSSMLLRALPDMRLKSTARNIFSLMHQARAQAIELGVPVAIKFDTDRNACILFRDNNNNGMPDPGEELRTLPLSSGVLFQDSKDSADSEDSVGSENGEDSEDPPPKKATIAFSPRGLPVQPGGTGLGMGSVTLEVSNHQGKKKTRKISVSSAGRITIGKSTITNK
jgi:prepilin-type N-terminal cleavage/methylation domain-containing protein